MQENRSFDNYFETFPGGGRIRMVNGVPTGCIADPASGVCVKPFHDSARKTTAVLTDSPTRLPTSPADFIDHQALSFDAYVKFIEDVFLCERRLDPGSDGRPDPRPTVRETVAALGDLSKAFDFSQAPRAPLLLPATPLASLVPSLVVRSTVRNFNGRAGQ